MKSIFHDPLDFKNLALDDFAKEMSSSVIRVLSYPDYKKEIFVFFDSQTRHIYMIVTWHGSRNFNINEHIANLLSQNNHKVNNNLARETEAKERIFHEKITMIEYFIEKSKLLTGYLNISEIKKWFFDYKLINPIYKNSSINEVIIKPAYAKIFRELVELFYEIIRIFNKKSMKTDFEFCLQNKLIYLKKQLSNVTSAETNTTNQKKTKDEILALFSTYQIPSERMGILFGSAPRDNCPFPKCVMLNSDFINKISMVDPSISQGTILLSRNYPAHIKRSKDSLFVSIQQIGIIKEIIPLEKIINDFNQL